VRFRRRRNSNENETKAPDETKSGGAVQNPKSDSSADVSAQPSRTENNDAKRTPDSKESAASENPSTEKEKTTANVGDPLARVNLVVVLKDGRKLEYSLADVLRFHVDGGILTITGKDGKVESYSMSQVQRVTIE
jgi:hypothetical protein